MSRLGEGGLALSGGQRRRLALARAVVRNPEVLILDECTSGLDECTRAQLLVDVEPLLKGRLTIVITHSDVWTPLADRSFYIENGAMLECQ